MIDLDFDGHPSLEFSEMDAEERLDDLSRKISLVLELRRCAAELVLPADLPRSR